MKTAAQPCIELPALEAILSGPTGVTDFCLPPLGEALILQR